MNIFEPEGDGDLIIPAAIDELKRSGGITNAEARRAVVATIQAAALLDIASSLRIVAGEALLAMNAAPLGPEEDDEQADEVEDFLVEGDLVAVNGHDEPGEVIALGFTEGASTVTVRFSSGAEARFWLSDVHRLVGDERDDDTMQTASEGGTPIPDPDEEYGVGWKEAADLDTGFDAPENVDPELLVDDIDDDFDGDVDHEAEAALAALKANEAARKAAKKGKKK